MVVDLHNLLDGCGLHQRAGDPLLHGEDDALARLDPDGRGAELDGFNGVLNLSSKFHLLQENIQIY